MNVLIFRGESTTLQADNLGATAWFDRKIVMLLYTGFDPTSTGQVVRRQKDGTQVSYTCQVTCASIWMESTLATSIVTTTMSE